MKERIIPIKQVKRLLQQGKTVFVQSVDGTYQNISRFIQKGTLQTFKVKLSNGYQIKVSRQHKFFQKTKGWILCKDLIVNQSQLLCDDGEYHRVIQIQNIGYHRIVDITVDVEHCYYGNGILNHNSGKSLICAHLIKSCQQQEGIPILIDTEAAANWQFMQAIGVNVQDVIYYDDLNTIQRIYKVIQELLYAVRADFPDRPVLIIVDSLTAASSQSQLENKDYQNKGYLAAIKAKMNSEALRKIAPMVARQKVALVMTAQVRQKMDVLNPYMDKYASSSGGLALSFYASMRIRLQQRSKLKQRIHGVQTVVGVRTSARIDKSRLGASNRQCRFDIFYDSGINNYSNWLQTLKKYKVVEGRGTINIPFVIKFKDKQITFRGKFNQVMRQNQQIRDQVYDVIAELLILKYKNIQETDDREVIVQDDIEE